MKVRLNVPVPNVADRNDVVDVPDQVGYAVCSRHDGTQLPPFRPATKTLTPEQIKRLARP